MAELLSSGSLFAPEFPRPFQQSSKAFPKTSLLSSSITSPATQGTPARLGVALQLSGHSHEGLIRGDRPAGRKRQRRYVSGRYDVDGMTLLREQRHRAVARRRSAAVAPPN